MNYIKKSIILCFFCAFLIACHEQTLTPEQECIGLQRQMIMNQHYDQNYSSGVTELRRNTLIQRYHDLGCKNFSSK